MGYIFLVILSLILHSRYSLVKIKITQKIYPILHSAPCNECHILFWGIYPIWFFLCVGPHTQDMTILAFFLDDITVFAKNKDDITIFPKKMRVLQNWSYFAISRSWPT